MKTWMLYGAGLLAILGLSPRATALPKGLGGQPASAAAAAGAAGAAPANLFSMLCPSPEQIEACKKKFCDSPLGKLINNSLKPVSIFTGGILGNCCPADKAPSLAEQAKPGAEGLAARIAAEEANAKARRAAARYLGTVDCHVFAGVDKALVELLRKDTNECVRLEAALALGRGCCCNKVTIQGLALTVAGSEKDGSRAEKSDRVRQAAAASLQHCLACVGTAAPEETEKKTKESPEPPKTREGEKPSEKITQLDLSSIQLSAYYKQVECMPFGHVVEDARKVLADYQQAQQLAMKPASRTFANLLVGTFGGLTTPNTSDGKTAAESGTAIVETPHTGPLMPVPAPQPVTPTISTVRVPTQPAPAAVQPAKATTSAVAPNQPAVTQTYRAPIQPVATPPAAAATPKTAAVIQSATPAATKLPVIQSTTPAPKAAVPVSASPVMTPAKPAPVATIPAASLGVVNGVNNMQQLLMVLKESIYPEQREWAAERLCQANCQLYPQVPATLLKSAREDAAPTVQVACIRCLVKMQYTSKEVVTALQAMRNDSDPRVRFEAGQALTKLTTPATGGVQQVVPAGYVPGSGR